MQTTIADQQVISIEGDRDIPLTKNQQEFNRLSKRIAKLKLQIETDRARMDVLHAVYMKLIPPLVERDARLRLDLARILADGSFRYKWPKNELATLTEAISTLCEQVFPLIEPSAEEKTFFNQWTKTSVGDDEGTVEAAEDEPADGPSWEWQEENYTSEWGHDRERKKRRKSFERELREQELLAMQQKSIRSVYLSLAKILHPDTAISEDERLQKEELIKQVTGAYQNRDLPTLLLLESEWVSRHTGHLARMDNDKLVLYIHALKDQLQILKRAHAEIFDDPKYLYVLEYSQVPEKKALQQIRLDAANRKRLIKDMEQNNRSLKKDISRKEILHLAEQIVWQSSAFDDWGTDENGQREWDNWSEEALIREMTDDMQD